jgi:hypothetical protein
MVSRTEAIIQIQGSDKRVHIAWYILTNERVRPDGKRPLERPRRRWEDILKSMFKEWGGEAGTGLLWIRTETGGGRLLM